MKILAFLVVLAGMEAQDQQPAPCLQRAEADRPYGHARLILMVQDNSRARAEYLIRTCGVSVPLTRELEGELRSAGAVEAVIAAVRDVAPPVGGSPRPDMRAQPKAGSTKVNPKDGLTYVWIPPGRFRFGCAVNDQECDSDEKPGRENVEITKGFWLGQTEVTQAAFQKVTGKTPSHFKGNHLPVESATWDEAQAYCSAIRGRLPSEAEWEYAAKAGTTRSRYGNLEQVAWYDENSGGQTHTVGQKEANPWTLKDMLGNVWEWTNDWYDSSLPAGRQDPVGLSSGTLRTLRGGYWGGNPRNVRASVRNGLAPGLQNDGLIGLRCVAE
jgi:formylglycine-generating enzyme required for sulfatase activity